MIEKFFVIIIISLPLQFALNVGDNFDLVTTRLFIPILFLLWLARGLARKKIWVTNKAEMWLVLSFLFLSLMSLFIGREASAGFRKLAYLLSVFPIFFVAADIFQDKKGRRSGVIAIMISVSLAAFLALVQFSLPLFFGLGKSVKIWEGIAPYFLGNSFGKIVAANSSWLVSVSGQTFMRAFGFFPDPHNFAFFVDLGLFLSLGYLFSKNKISHKAWICLALIAMAAAIVLSFSRGAYLGLIAGIIFFATIFLKRSGALGRAAAIGGILLAVLVFFNSNIISQRLASSFNLKEGSNAERYKNWEQALEIVQDYPLGGVGLGNYAQTVDPTAGDRSSIYAHNLFLDIAAETGILNAAVFLFLILTSVWRNVKKESPLGLGIASSLVAFLVHSMFDTALYSPQVLTMLLVIVAMGLYSNQEDKISNEKTTAKN